MDERLWFGLIVGGFLPGWKRRANARMLMTLGMWRQLRELRLQYENKKRELDVIHTVLLQDFEQFARQLDR